jgi:hypothetical protein
MQTLQEILTACMQCLQGGSGEIDPVESISADEQQQQQSQDLGGSSAGVAGGSEGVDVAARLTALGVCLSSLPLSWGCNNPYCTNIQGPAEALIVQGKGHQCNSCCKGRTFSRSHPQRKSRCQDCCLQGGWLVNN